MKSVEKLISIGSGCLSRQAPAIDLTDFRKYGRPGEELLDVLKRKNGFYAFESALHVYPAALDEDVMTLSRWNAPDLWRSTYGDLIGDALFFAEDAFGDQFCLNGENICSFRSESGNLTRLGSSLEEWAGAVLENYDVLTAYPLISAWQKQHGPIQPGTRLAPKIPFVLGGEYWLDNLWVCNSVSAMRFRGRLASEIKDLPDGAQIEVRLTDSTRC